MFSAPTDGNGLLVPLVTVIFSSFVDVAHTRFLGCIYASEVGWVSGAATG
jgi:hypothetical protein